MDSNIEKNTSRLAKLRETIAPNGSLDVDRLCEIVDNLQLEATDLKKSLAEETAKRTALDQALPLFNNEHTAVKYLGEVRIDAVFPIPEEWGFYEVEFDEAGRAYRWTGPGRYFYFNLFLDRTTARTGTLMLGCGVIPENLTHLRAYVGSMEVPLKQKETSDNSVQYDFTIDCTDGRATTTLTFLVPRSESPASSGGGDVRNLGVSFRQLIIR